MRRLSSSWTLILKLFLPVLWLSFFVPLSIAILFSRDVRQLFDSSVLTIGIFVFLITGALFFYLTTWKLRRVDGDDQYFYVSNYFKTIKFPYAYPARIEERNLLLFRLFILELPQKGRLGRKLHFLESGSSFRSWVAENPQLFSASVLDESSQE